MIMLLGMGVMTTVAIFYMGKKGWQALHKAVGITPGVLTYYDNNAPLLLPDMTWEKLQLDIKQLNNLPDLQLHQLQRIDKKVAIYHTYQQHLQAQSNKPTLTEQQFVLHKLLHTRLPEMIASHHYLVNSINHKNMNTIDSAKYTEANELLQEAFDNIEQRLDTLLEQLKTQQLQDLHVMKRYLDSHDIP